MAKFVKGNILDAQHGIIAHSVSCNLAMKKGLSKKIRDKYPIVLEDCAEIMGAVSLKDRLGKCQLIQVTKSLFIANLFTQIGPLVKGLGHIDYNAFAMSLASLRIWRERVFSPAKDMPIYIPSHIGCNLGSEGDWNIIKGIVIDAIPDAIIVREVTEADLESNTRNNN